MRPINKLIVHHSASPLSTTAAQIARWHAARFRLGIGYQRIIEADGSVLDGRKIQRQGAHARGSNADSIGVCVVGNNTVPEFCWTVRQCNSLASVILYYHDLYPLMVVMGHQDAPGASTLCPGLDIAKWCSDRLIQVPTLGR